MYIEGARGAAAKNNWNLHFRTRIVYWPHERRNRIHLHTKTVEPYPNSIEPEQNLPSTFANTDCITWCPTRQDQQSRRQIVESTFYFLQSAYMAHGKLIEIIDKNIVTLNQVGSPLLPPKLKHADSNSSWNDRESFSYNPRKSSLNSMLGR